MHYLLYRLSTAQVELLPPDALDTQERKAWARRGKDYLVMRSLLKRELSRLCGIPAQEIRFEYTELGKPIFAAQPFNISHSGDMLCIAFHHDAVGVDIERRRPRQHLHALASRIMCPEQLAAWHARQCPEEEFYDCWCTAEALSKQCGSSVWQAQARPFLWHSNGIQTLYEDAPRIELFQPAEGFHGAVAYQD